MKYNDFKMIDYSKNGRNDSKFYNMKNLSNNYKLVTYFINYFSNHKIMTVINRGKGEVDPYLFKNDLPDFIYKRIDVMTEYIIDEKTNFFNSAAVDIVTKKDDNVELLKMVISVKIALMLTSSFSRKQPVKSIDEYFRTLFYKILTHYGVGEIIDDIILNKGNIEKIIINNTNNKESEKQEKELDYDFNRDKEYAIMTSIINVNLNSIDRYSNMKDSISIQYSSLIGSYNIMTGRDIQFENKYSLYEAIRDLKTELLCKNLDEEFKEKMLSKINDLISDKNFDDVNEYKNLSSTLCYGGERPVDKSEKLMERYGDIEKYKYKGIVYHGFHNVNGTADVIGALRYYENGYISCSKDIRIAKNFSNTYESGLFGGIIEIYVDETVEAIDIEKILEDEFNKSNNRYKDLYNNFIHEKEVLIKMPIKKYRYISPSEYERCYSKNKKYSTYEPKKEVQPIEK